MKRLTLICLLCLISGAACAEMMGRQTLDLDFTNVNVSTRARWSSSSKVDITRKGLGVDGDSAEVIDLSLETTEPLGLGVSWRPPQSATVSVEIAPPLQEIILPNGQSSVPFVGEMFVRYSADARHWSDWQVIPNERTVNGESAQWKFRGEVAVPRKNREQYESYLYRYYKMDVPWSSDEEALVKWILTQDPQFFEKELPFVGFVEFLYEGNLPAGQRIQNVKISVDNAVSGLATIPKDPKIQKGRDVPWRFKAP